MKHIKEFEIEAQTGNNGDEESWIVEVEIETVTDPNYGADADGNRGMSMTFIDGVKILSAKRDLTGLNATEEDLKILQPLVDELVEQDRLA
jgi:hypothetical protein